MTILEITILAAGLAGVIAVAIFVAWWLMPVRETRLMRCPVTGTVAFVRIEQAPAEVGWPAGPVVHSCDLWPLAKPCYRGCLKRYHETAPGSRVNVESLRPFGNP